MITANKSLMSMCAADIMSRNMVMIPCKMSLHAAAHILSLAGATGGIVLDDAGCCIGVLSPIDFLHSVEHDREPHTRRNGKTDGISQSWQIPEGNAQTGSCVEEFMAKDPVMVPPTTPLVKLAQMMADAHIHRIIVVDMATHRPLGIVSSLDILAAVGRVDQSATGNERTSGDLPSVSALP